VGLAHKLYTSQRKFALLAGLCGGVLSCIVDVDHVVAYEKGWDYLLVRPWHTPILIVASIVLGCCCALLGRFYVKLVLKEKKK